MNPTRWLVLCKFILNMPNFAKLDILPRLLDLAPNSFRLFKKKKKNQVHSRELLHCHFLQVPYPLWASLACPEDGWGLGWFSTCLPGGRFQRHSEGMWKFLIPGYEPEWRWTLTPAVRIWKDSSHSKFSRSFWPWSGELWASVWLLALSSTGPMAWSR